MNIVLVEIFEICKGLSLPSFSMNLDLVEYFPGKKFCLKAFHEFSLFTFCMLFLHNFVSTRRESDDPGKISY